MSEKRVSGAFSDVEDDFDENDVVIEEAKSMKINQLSTDKKSNSSSMASLVQMDRSVDEITSNYDDLDLEFETFNGSLDDNVEKKPVTPVVTEAIVDEDEFNFVSPNLSYSNLINVEGKTIPGHSSGNSIGLDADTANTTAEEPKLTVLKTRDLNTVTKEYVRKTSNFKAVKIDKDVSPSEHQTKVKDLRKLCSKLDQKVKKINEEIEYLDYLNANTPSIEEISKLKRAKELLLNKLDSVQKDKYNSTVKLNHLILKSPTIQGGEYWSRSVS